MILYHLHVFNWKSNKQHKQHKQLLVSVISSASFVNYQSIFYLICQALFSKHVSTNLKILQNISDVYLYHITRNVSVSVIPSDYFVNWRSIFYLIL